MSGAALVVVLLLVLAGNGLLRLTALRTESGPERLGFSFAAGCTLLAGGSALLSPFALATPPALVGLLAAATLAPILAGRPNGRTELTENWPTFLPALLLVALSLWLAALRPVWNVDALMRWVLHGQWLAAEGSLVPDRMADPAWAPTHPGYPPLVPAVVGLAIGLGADPGEGVRVLFPFFLLALLGILHGFGLRTLGKVRAWMLPLAFGLTPAVLWLPARGPAFGLGADAALADLPLALMLTGLAVPLLDAVRHRTRPAVGATALLAAGAVWTKQEGAVSALLMLLLAAAAAAAWPRGERGRVLARIGLVLAAATLALIGWRAVAARMPVAAGEDYLSAGGIAAVFAGFDRLGPILARLGRELADFRTWGALWPAALFTGILALVRRNGSALLPLAWLGLGFLVAVAGFVASGWRGGDYAHLMEVSLTRLLLHHAPLAALALAELGRPRPPVAPAR